MVASSIKQKKMLKALIDSYAPRLIKNLIADQYNFRAEYLQNCEEN